jgi:hemolysin activation/secretion protein
MEQRLRAMQDDPRIDRIDARLVPTASRGEADLELTVHESSPVHLSLELDNQQSPGVAEAVARIELSHLNLTGNGDVLRGSWASAEGLDQLEVAYEHPIGSGGTTISYRYDRTESKIIEDPFDNFDIGSRGASYTVQVRQAIRADDPRVQLELTFGAQIRRSKEFLLDRGFSFSEGPEEGVTRLSVLQFGQEFTRRGSDQVFAARSAFRCGIGILGATTGKAEPDGRFVSWLGQAQWARRLRGGPTLLLRADVQLSNDPLPGIEQFGIGGQSTVRGYRENRIVRDNGAVGSAELRVPLLQRPNAESPLEVIPFLDFGRSWNRERSAEATSLWSAGIGLLWRLRAGVSAEIYYAHPFRDLRRASNDRALQDRGVHFRIRASL